MKKRPGDLFSGPSLIAERFECGSGSFERGLICCLLLRRQRVQAGSLVFPAGPFQVLQHRPGGGGEKEAGLFFAAFRVFQILCPEKPLADGLLQGQSQRTAGKTRKVRQIPAGDLRCALAEVQQRHSLRQGKIVFQRGGLQIPLQELAVPEGVTEDAGSGQNVRTHLHPLVAQLLGPGEDGGGRRRPRQRPAGIYRPSGGFFRILPHPEQF